MARATRTRFSRPAPLPSRRVLPRLEVLEDRLLLSALTSAPTPGAASSALVVGHSSAGSPVAFGKGAQPASGDESRPPVSTGKAAASLSDLVFSTLSAGLSRKSAAEDGTAPKGSVLLPPPETATPTDGGDPAADSTRGDGLLDGGDLAPESAEKDEPARTAEGAGSAPDSDTPGDSPARHGYEIILQIARLKLEENPDGTLNYEGKLWDPDELAYHLDRAAGAGQADTPEDPAETGTFHNQEGDKEQKSGPENQAQPANDADGQRDATNHPDGSPATNGRRQPGTNEPGREEGGPGRLCPGEGAGQADPPV